MGCGVVSITETVLLPKPHDFCLSLNRSSAIKNKVKVEPRALRCCEQKSALCCSPCIRCDTRRRRALSTHGLSDGMNHGHDDVLGEA